MDVAIFGRLRSRLALGLVATMLCPLLDGCGGGGAPDALAERVPEAALAVVPAAYSARLVEVPFGDQAGVIGSLDSRGRFLGLYLGANGHAHVYLDDGPVSVALTDPAAELDSVGAALSDTGWVAGTIDFEFGTGLPPRAFAWRSETGLVEVASGIAGFEWSRATAATDSGLVAGDLCEALNFDDSSCTAAFIWDSSDRSVAQFPRFRLSSMNEAGTMVGFSLSPTCPEGLALLHRDGSLQPLGLGVPVVEPGAGNGQPFIADDGTVFVNAVIGNGVLAPGAVVVDAKGARNIGRGVAVPPGAMVSLEENRYTAANRFGHVAGSDFAHYTDEQGREASSAIGFYWNARDGASAIRLGENTLVPTVVNKDGLVGGVMFAPGSTQSVAFVWSKTSGALPLETRVSNMPGLRLSEITDIGDGGHILAHSEEGHWVLLTPQDQP
jgi:hypothetical protein